MDRCCSKQLSNLEVRVGGEDQRSKSTANANICGSYGDTDGKRILEIPCKTQMAGYFVTVLIPGGWLTLCEVLVMAQPKQKGD